MAFQANVENDQFDAQLKEYQAQCMSLEDINCQIQEVNAVLLIWLNIWFSFDCVFQFKHQCATHIESEQKIQYQLSQRLEKSKQRENQLKIDLNNYQEQSNEIHSKMAETYQNMQIQKNLQMEQSIHRIFDGNVKSERGDLIECRPHIVDSIPDSRSKDSVSSTYCESMQLTNCEEKFELLHLNENESIISLPNDVSSAAESKYERDEQNDSQSIASSFNVDQSKSNQSRIVSGSECQYPSIISESEYQITDSSSVRQSINHVVGRNSDGTSSVRPRKSAKTSSGRNAKLYHSKNHKYPNQFSTQLTERDASNLSSRSYRVVDQIDSSVPTEYHQLKHVVSYKSPNDRLRVEVELISIDQYGRSGLGIMVNKQFPFIGMFQRKYNLNELTILIHANDFDKKSVLFDDAGTQFCDRSRPCTTKMYMDFQKGMRFKGSLFFEWVGLGKGIRGEGLRMQLYEIRCLNGDRMTAALYCTNRFCKSCQSNKCNPHINPWYKEQENQWLQWLKSLQSRWF